MDGLTDGRTIDGWKDRHLDVQRETIIPRHYRVAGYNSIDPNQMLHSAESGLGLHCLSMSCLWNTRHINVLNKKLLIFLISLSVLIRSSLARHF